MEILEKPLPRHKGGCYLHGSHFRVQLLLNDAPLCPTEVHPHKPQSLIHEEPWQTDHLAGWPSAMMGGQV